LLLMAGDDLLVPEMAELGGQTMCLHFSTERRSQTVWRARLGHHTFTRLTQAARPLVDACARNVARRFQALGVGSDTQTRQTPRG
jgi:hypothetical protein